MPKREKSCEEIFICTSYCSTTISDHNRQANTRVKRAIKKPQKMRDIIHKEQIEECAESFLSLISMINKQFSNFSSQFPLKQKKQSITPNGESHTHKQKLIPLLPTIHECARLSQSQDESSRKEKEETAIRSTPSRVW